MELENRVKITERTVKNMPQPLNMFFKEYLMT